MNRIKELRTAKGWKQKELADHLNVATITISRYELEQRQLDPVTINGLCDLFGVTADYLLCRSNTPNPAITEEDALILRAYHAASLRDRGLIDQILQAYVEEADNGKSVG